eukprot:COSAG04_NODE_56_length_30604_cov_692.571119_36_plen_81_part_00
MGRRGFLPPLAPQAPEQRVDARLRRIVREPRGASRGGGVLLRSELVEQNEALAWENEELLPRATKSARCATPPWPPSSPP